MEYYKTFLDRKTRPDGRNLLEFREMTLNVGSIGTADGSAIVKCGNTTIVAGIKAVSFLASNQIINSLLIFKL